jgi:hypothetical protein
MAPLASAFVASELSVSPATPGWLLALDRSEILALARSTQSHHPASDKERTMGWVVGLDVHKDTIAATVLRPTGDVAAEATFDNTDLGHTELHTWITTNATEPRYGLEPSVCHPPR